MANAYCTRWSSRWIRSRSSAPELLSTSFAITNDGQFPIYRLRVECYINLLCHEPTGTVIQRTSMREVLRLPRLAVNPITFGCWNENGAQTYPHAVGLAWTMAYLTFKVSYRAGGIPWDWHRPVSFRGLLQGDSTLRWSRIPAIKAKGNG